MATIGSNICNEVVLKGGSLNRTSILEFESGKKVVRKSIDRVSNREYGYVRWYSQMKRIQRYNSIFPNLFPTLIDVGVGLDFAYFDIEYISNGFDLKRYLTKFDPNEEEIERINDALWDAMDRIHETRLTAPLNSLELYFAEEVEQKLSDAMQNNEFAEFAAGPVINFHGQEIPALLSKIEEYKCVFSGKKLNNECMTHGNITLENVIYVPDENRIIFIDPYDENIVDCVENEYSQILQCSKDKYGLINDSEVVIDGNQCQFYGEIPKALTSFDEKFSARMLDKISDDSYQLVKLFEISQFVRMLPFKVLTNEVKKAQYFYGLASKLFWELSVN